jgi:hypothetical protein
MYLQRLTPWLIISGTVLFGHSAHGQCNPAVTPSISCEDAPLICLQDFCFTSQEDPFFCCNGWCGANTAIHNPQYFELQAISTEISIHIHVDSCNDGTGLQGAILSACPWTNMHVLVCDPGTPPGGTMVLDYSGLIAGETYWLLIDGSNGSTCQYSITYVSGVNAPGGSFELLQEMTTVEPDYVCPGYTGLHLQTGPAPLQPAQYTWETGWDHGIYTTTEPDLMIDIPVDAPEGLWDICVTAKSACDTSNRVCVQIEIEQFQDAVKPESILCADAFPFVWGVETITGPGIYAESFILPGNCVIDSIWIIESYPVYPDGMVDTSLCASAFEYEGITYSHSGVYALTYPALGANGCDSTAYLHLTLGGMDLIVETNCDGPEPVLHPHVILHDDDIDTLLYAWHSCNYDTLISTENILQPDSMQCYSLIVDNGLCRDTTSAAYVLDCPSTCDLTPDFLCVGDSVMMEYAFNVGPEAQIHWVVTSPDTTLYYFEGGEDVYFTHDQPGVYTVSAMHVETGVSFTCEDMFVIPEPVSADICCHTTLCGDCAELTVTSGSVPVDVILSDGTGELHLIGITSSTVEVCPPTGVPTTYSLIEIIDSATGCPGFASGSGEADVLLHEVPNVMITQNFNTLCAMVNGQNQYRWLPCESGDVLANTQCFTPVESGCYCVEATNTQGCRDTACVEIIVTSIDEPLSPDVRLFPNPTSSRVQYELTPQFYMPATWILTDVFGRQVGEGRLWQDEGQIAFPEGLAKGTYFIQLHSGNSNAILEKILIH